LAISKLNVLATQTYTTQQRVYGLRATAHRKVDNGTFRDITEIDEQTKAVRQWLRGVSGISSQTKEAWIAEYEIIALFAVKRINERNNQHE